MILVNNSLQDLPGFKPADLGASLVQVLPTGHGNGGLARTKSKNIKNYFIFGLLCYHDLCILKLVFKLQVSTFLLFIKLDESKISSIYQ